MALIKCNECGQMVSDKASNCPNCGAPVVNKPEEQVLATKVEKTADQQPQERQTRRKNIAIVLLSVALFVVVVVLLILLLRGWNTTNTINENLISGGDATLENVVEKEEVQAESSNTINGHEYVDLGLSVMWAACNVGASSPEDYGDYFAWGETSTKSEYTDENCKTYCGKSIGSIAGNPQCDAAQANWGDTWRMPTVSEIDELVNKCTRTWTTRGGHNGYKITGPNGNSIFLPAAGWRVDTSLYGEGEEANYWSATPYEFERRDVGYIANILHITNCDFSRSGLDFFYGQSVRPVSPTSNSQSSSSATVSDPTGYIKGHSYVDLGLSVKWATCNVGASSPSGYGNYYAWGETKPKETYTYKNNLTNQKNIESISGKPQYDAATANWGDGWRIPTDTEWKELAEKCEWKWTSQDGHMGCLVTGRNGNSIFLPAAGERDNDREPFGGTEYGYYWSGAPYNDYEAMRFSFCEDEYSEYNIFKNNGDYYRATGCSVRPVSE